MTSTWAQKSKTDSKFSCVSFGEFFVKLGGVVTAYISYKNTLFLLKSVRANLIYVEKWQITEYWKHCLNNLDFLPIQNVRQCHFHDVAKYEKNFTEGKCIHIKGLITWAGLARLARLLRCAEMTFSPVLHEASQSGWWLMWWTRETGASLILVWRRANELGWPGKRDYMEKSQPG